MAATGGLAGRVVAAVDSPPGPAVVALSGGPDSAVCAWVLCRKPYPVRAVHVHHGFPASDDLSEAAARIAETLGVGLELLRVAVPPGPSPEDQARRVRYRALLGALRPHEWLATGHTQDDQAESVLLAMARGAGTDGLAGIPAVRGRVIRPLLSVSRSETRELATALDLPWVEDPTNLAPGPARNRVRRLLAELNVQWPRLPERVARTARLVSVDAALLDRMARSIPVEVRGEEARLLIGAEASIAARAVRRALRAIRGPHGGTQAEVEAALDVAYGRCPSATLGGATRVAREGPWLVFFPAAGAKLPAPAVWDPSTELAWGMFRFVPAADPLARPLSPWRAGLPAGKATIRAATGPDRVAITSGHKRAWEALAEAGVPARRRPTWPLVEKEGEVLWIPGVRWAAGLWPAGRADRYLWVMATEAPWASAP